MWSISVPRFSRIIINKVRARDGEGHGKNIAMKKVYSNPEMEVVRMETMSMLAESPTLPTNGTQSLTEQDQFLAPEGKGDDNELW